MREIMKKPELLLPAGRPEVLRTAIRFGADAVYIGGEAFSLRAGAKNFTEEEMADAISFAHERGKKVYVTANILAHDSDLEEARGYFTELEKLQPDGVLVSDPGIFQIAKETCPDIDIHISTQANNVNFGTFRFWHSLGATRVVCGRELSLEEIKEIRKNIPEDLEIEAFVHGAMCISYSGRCLLSNFLTGRDANRGQCTHPCRWQYSLVEETRPGEYMPVMENERGTYIFNSKDLCMVQHIPELVEAGINSLKVEGRMKNALYVATAARTYRRAIDDYFESPEKYEANKEWYMQEICSTTYRPFSTGFFFGKPGEEAQIYDSNTYRKGCTYLGIIQKTDEKGFLHLSQRNKFSVGETVEVMLPQGQDLSLEVKGIYAEDGSFQESAPHPSQEVAVDLGISGKGICVPDGSILRRREPRPVDDAE